MLYVDNDYQYAAVGGGTENYLWILSREQTMENDVYKKLVDIAQKRGYNTELLQKF